MKILICQVITPEIKEYSSYSLPINLEYSINKNFDYQLYTSKVDSNDIHHPSWLKIKCLYDINWSKYDWVWVIDADVIINNTDINLVDLINKDPKPIIMSENGFNGGRLLNAGSFILNKKIIPEVLRKYEECIKNNVPHLIEKFWEQEMFNDWFESNPELFSVRNMNEINSYWKIDANAENNFVHHYMGSTDDDRVQKMKKYSVNRMLKKMKRMKIGITLGLGSNTESIWTNGIKLNVLNLVNLLKKSKKNYDVCILNTIKADLSVKPHYLSDINIYDFKDKFMDMDLIIVMGAQVHSEDLIKFKENKNKRVISYKCGNNYILHVEETLFKNQRDAQYEKEFDEVWYIPQQHETNEGFYHTLYRTNAFVVPFLWDSRYLEESLQQIDLGFQKGDYKKDSKYVLNKDKKAIGIMEPNLNVVKYALIPTMIVEESYRTDVGKNNIQKLMVTNATELGKNKNFMSIIKTFDLFKDGKISAESRYQTAYIVTQHLDVVVCHQLLNPLNYLYLDLVYMGYPVLHNAYMCKDVGYYYEGSSTIEGAEMLNHILLNHDKNHEQYIENNKKILERYSINNPKLIETYDKLIHNLFNGGNSDLTYDIYTNNYI